MVNAKKICQNCGSELGEFVCSRCSLLVGKLCYNAEEKVCVLCEGSLVV